MKTVFVAVAVAALCVGLAQAAKTKCYKDDALVHDNESFKTCMDICKKENDFNGEITPAIYECMLRHFEVVNGDGNVDVEKLKTKLKTIAQPDVLPNILRVLQTECTMKELKEFARCMDGKFENECSDGEQ